MSAYENFEHVAYHKVFENECVLCELEEMRRPCDGATMLFIHARFTAQWSPRLFKECLKNWHTFRTVVTAPIFASPQVHDAKWEKFITAFGFQPLIGAAPCNDGEVRPIWIHYGKLPNHSAAEQHDPLGSAGCSTTNRLRCGGEGADWRTGCGS